MQNQKFAKCVMWYLISSAESELKVSERTFRRKIFKYKKNDVSEQLSVLQNNEFCNLLVKSPNKLAASVTFLSCFRDVPCSNLCRDTDYRDWDLLWYSSILASECQGNTLN
jgi:hypothetical protein